MEFTLFEFCGDWRDAELLRDWASSFAWFTIVRSGEWGGVTTANGFGDGRGEFAECFPNWMSSMLPLIGVRVATYKYDD